MFIHCDTKWSPVEVAVAALWGCTKAHWCFEVNDDNDDYYDDDDDGKAKNDIKMTMVLKEHQPTWESTPDISQWDVNVNIVVASDGKRDI